MESVHTLDSPLLITVKDDGICVYYSKVQKYRNKEKPCLYLGGKNYIAGVPGAKYETHLPKA